MRFFHVFANKVSYAVGQPYAFFIAALIILVWAINGPLFDFSNTWQLVINTGTTIITFLMVFLIQNAQNRDAKAIHLKLDELLKGTKGARTSMVNIEDSSDAELAVMQDEYRKLHDHYAAALATRRAHMAAKQAAKTQD
jgi:low affinity Fe/Cu permease